MTPARPAPRAAGRPTLVAVAHGSRDPRALPVVRALLARVGAARPGLDVRLGHVELNAPLLTDTLAALRGPVVLVPLLLSRGHHVRHDLPAALAAAPWVHGTVAAPLGPHPLLAEVLHDRLRAAGRPPAQGGPAGPDAAAPAGVVLAAAGSRDPDAGRDTSRAAGMLAARLGVPVLPAYASAAAPTVEGAVAALVARGVPRGRIAVASYFTAPGRFAAQSAAAAPWIAGEPLGAHPAMARLVLHRYDEAIRAQHPLARAS